MAKVNGGLQISKCSCETGRKRHRLPRSVQIPFEAPPSTANHPHGGDDADDADAIMHVIEDEFGAETEEEDEDDDDDADADSITGHLAEIMEAEAEAGLVVDPNPNMDAWGGTVLFAEDEEVEDAGMDSDDGAPDWDGSDSDPDDNNMAPHIARWRLNLAGLSQVYNLYFVAYRNQIHISSPRSCVTNALPPTPDLVLKPRPSAVSYTVGGGIDRVFPHQVNHLVIGDLGEEEILLLAYDDGDVIAYYTKHIENALVLRDESGNEKPRAIQPFFHENVGKSAWGLAIHKKSRLIAVGSNAHSVTVFIFALTGLEYHHIPGADPAELFRNLVKNGLGDITNPSGSSWADLNEEQRAQRATAMENLIKRRDANWRIVLETGGYGDNIPNVTFTNDASGKADKIAAVDVKGNIWLMEIWRFDKCPHIRIDQIHRHPNLYRRRLFDPARNSRPRGWGILVLPESSFMPTEDCQESLGLPEVEARYASNERIGHWIDISKGIKYIKDNSTDHPWLRWGQLTRFAFNPQDRRPSDLDSWFDFQSVKFSPMVPTLREPSSSPSPHSSPPGRGRPGGPNATMSKAARKGKSKTVLGDGSSILRTYEMDLELRSFEEDGVGIMFERAIQQKRPPQTVLPTMGWSHERLSNLLHVPGLSLVVAASLCGRVALVTLTRPKYAYLSFKRGFKIEAILPTKSDEDKHLRPICPLLGVAVSPVFHAGNTGKTDERLAPRRYRLMLHYYDLRILSYELSRDSTTDNLSIIP